MAGTKELSFAVTGMTCANCALAVERNSKKVQGVAGAQVNFAAEDLKITFDPGLVNEEKLVSQVVERIEKAGYQLVEKTGTVESKDAQTNEDQNGKP